MMYINYLLSASSAILMIFGFMNVANMVRNKVFSADKFTFWKKSLLVILPLTISSQILAISGYILLFQVENIRDVPLTPIFTGTVFGLAATILPLNRARRFLLKTDKL